MNKLLGTLFLLLFSLSDLQAQIPPVSEAQAQEELRKRGLTEDEMRQKLEEKGIDVDNIDPSQIGEVEKALEEAVQELEAEKASEAPSGAIAPDPDPGTVDDVIESDDPIDELTVETAEEQVRQAIEELPAPAVYGQHIFRNNRIQVYTQAEDVRPAESYVLGPSDRVNVSIWGLSQEEATYTINELGYIKPSRMPRISLQGLTLKQARQLIESRYAQYYRFRPEEFEVTVTYSRVINVNIYGEVVVPGGYTLPATNTAFNALMAAGGPSNIGSVRKIKLIRAGETKPLDVYEYMLDPSVREDFYLQDNDIIHVGVANRIVSINGAVRRSYQYELAEGEQLKKLIEYAGGLQPNAYTDIIQVRRFVDNEEKIIDVKLDEILKGNRDFELKGGDFVVIGVIPKPYKNFVEISGAVELPAIYELTNGMRISDLVNKAVLAEGARTDIAFILTTNDDQTVKYTKIDLAASLQNPASPENRLLTRRDRVFVLSKATYIDEAKIYVEGAVRETGFNPFDIEKQTRVADAILLKGGLRQDAAEIGYVMREDPTQKKEKEYIRINVRNAIDNPGSSDNIILQPNDVIVVYSNTDYKDQFQVVVSGAVRKPGEYTYDPSLTLQDVLTMAGGLKLEASRSRIDISRVVINENAPTETVIATVEVNDKLEPVTGDLSLEPFDQIMVRHVPEFRLQRNITIEGEVKYPGTYALIDDNEKMLSIIKRAGGLTNEAFPEGATLYRSFDQEGFVVTKLEEVLKNPNSRYNFILKKGDRIDVPRQKDLVSILLANTDADELYNKELISEGQINVAYHAGKNAKFYINEYAAGFAKDAKRGKTAVEYPSGKIKQTRNFGFFRIYPKVTKGSQIKVAKKVKKEKPEKAEKEKVDWESVIGNSVAQATAVLTLILLIQQINK